MRLTRFALFLVAAAGACGGRTGLFFDSSTEPVDDAGGEGGSVVLDGGERPPADGATVRDAPAADAPDAVVLPLSAPCGSPLGLQPGSPWPIAQRCPARAGYTTVVTAASPRLAWQTPAGSRWSPDVVVAADGTIYAYDLSRGLVALAPDGTTRWATAIPVGAAPQGLPPPDTSLAIGVDGTVYGWNGELTAIRPDGSIAWTWDPGPGTTFNSTAKELSVGRDGTVYVVEWLQEPSLEASLVAVDTSGTAQWTTSLGDALPLSPSVGPAGTIYVLAQGSNSLTAFTPDGGVAWTTSLGATLGAVGPVTIGDDGTVYASCAAGTCTFTADGSALSVFPLGGTVTLSPTDGLVLIGDSSAFTTEGKLAWGGVGSISTPIVDGRGTILIDFEHGASPSTTALDPTAHVLWKLDAGAPVAVGADGTIYALDTTRRATLSAVAP
jgi:hypothetical protein